VAAVTPFRERKACSRTPLRTACKPPFTEVWVKRKKLAAALAVCRCEVRRWTETDGSAPAVFPRLCSDSGWRSGSGEARPSSLSVFGPWTVVAAAVVMQRACPFGAAGWIARRPQPPTATAHPRSASRAVVPIRRRCVCGLGAGAPLSRPQQPFLARKRCRVVCDATLRGRPLPSIPLVESGLLELRRRDDLRSLPAAGGSP